MFGWMFAFVYAVVLLAFFNWWDRHVPRRYRYSHRRKWRANRLVLFFKTVVIAGVAIYPLVWLLGFEWQSFALGIVGGVGFLVAFCWIGCRLVGAALFGNDPGYRALIADGFDPFWDTYMPGVINRDPEEVRAGKPPLVLLGSNFCPPASWKDRCPACGAAQPEPVFWCFACGFGFENGCRKIVCPAPDCGMTFKESSPGRSREVPVTCPGCGKSWWFPQPGTTT